MGVKRHVSSWVGPESQSGSRGFCVEDEGDEGNVLISSKDTIKVVPVLNVCLLLPLQLSSISKAINSTEVPVKEKHARRILSNNPTPTSCMKSVPLR